MFERLLMENMGTYEPYERTDNTFNMANTKRFAGDIVCPEIDKTVIHRYIDFGNEDRWGKGRPAPLTNSEWAADVFAASPVGVTSDANSVGIDVLGPGGSQWTMAYSAAGIVGMSRGLPDDQTPVLRLPLQDLIRLREEPQAFTEQFASFLDVVSDDERTTVAAELLTALSNGAQLTSAG